MLALGLERKNAVQKIGNGYHREVRQPARYRRPQGNETGDRVGKEEVDHGERYSDHAKDE
jgi:hypothetical protein